MIAERFFLLLAVVSVMLLGAFTVVHRDYYGHV